MNVVVPVASSTSQMVVTRKVFPLGPVVQMSSRQNKIASFEFKA
jgi:hypothetical protein